MVKSKTTRNLVHKVVGEKTQSQPPVNMPSISGANQFMCLHMHPAIVKGLQAGTLVTQRRWTGQAIPLAV